MTISKIQAESINLSDTFAFTGTVTGAGDEAKILSFGSYNSGYGSGARLVTTSQSWVNLEINGTNQAVFGQITKNSDDSLNYNKTSNSSHLIISINFPSYNNNGGSGNFDGNDVLGQPFNADLEKFITNFSIMSK